MTFGAVWTAAAIFALVKFHGSPILVPFTGSALRKKLLVIWTNQSSLFVYPEIHSTVWIVTILLILGSFPECPVSVPDIHYYNHKRRQHKLNCLPPATYRSVLEAA